MIIAVDFDGTVVQHQFPNIGPPVPGAIDWLKRFKEAGARLILWTMRSDSTDGKTFLTAAVHYLHEADVLPWAINENPEQACWTASPKVYAHYYIDDANAGCPLVYPDDGGRPYVDWSIIGPQVMAQMAQLE